MSNLKRALNDMVQAIDELEYAMWGNSSHDGDTNLIDMAHNELLCAEWNVIYFMQNPTE